MPALPPDEHRCTAKSKQSQQRCKKWRQDEHELTGITVCEMHGGKSPQVRNAGNIRREEARAQKILDKRGYSRVEDPVEALADLAGEVVAAKDFFRERIETLRYEHRAGEQLRAEVALYERALDRCLKVLSEITRLGIAERRQRINEAQALMILTILQNTLNSPDLGLTAKQKAIAGTVLQAELVAAGEIE